MSRIPNVEVRVVGDEDVPAWAHLTAVTVDSGSSLTEPEIAAALAQGTPHMREISFLAWSMPAARAIARLRLSLHGERAEVWGLGVDPQAAEQGLEPAIIRAIEARARVSGVRHLLVQVAPNRVSLLTRAGYRLNKARIEMAADLVRRPISVDQPLRHPGVNEKEIQAVGRLYYDAYYDTIDYNGETPEDGLDEARRCMTGDYGPFLAGCSFVIDGEEGLAGAALITQESEDSKDEVLLAEVIVSPRYRGRGYARLLIQAAMNACLHQGKRRMWLMVTRNNVPAEGLYRRMGFEEVPGSEVYHLTKEL